MQFVVFASELRESLAACAEEIGVGYSTLDSRLLFRYPQKTTYGNKSTNVSQSNSGYDLLTTNIEEVLRKAPCILHIESFDTVFHDPAQQHASNPDDSQEELFLQAFQAFCNDLYSNIESNYQCNSTKKNATDINQHSLVLVVSTNQSTAIKPRMKALFSAEIKLPQTGISASQFTTLLQQCSVYTTNDTVSTDTGTQILLINAEAEKLLYNHVHTHALSYAATVMLIDEVKKRTIARVDSPIWIHTLGIDTTNTTLPLQPVAQCTTTSTLQITSSDVKKALSEVPCLNAFDTTSGLESQKGGQKQASIAPVHWADIGGLDR